MPNGRRLNLYLPKVVLKVVSIELLSSSLICQKELDASNTEKCFAPDNFALICPLSLEGYSVRDVLISLTLSDLSICVMKHPIFLRSQCC